jgi:hypothetical protein
VADCVFALGEPLHVRELLTHHDEIAGREQLMWRRVQLHDDA